MNSHGIYSCEVRCKNRKKRNFIALVILGDISRVYIRRTSCRDMVALYGNVLRIRTRGMCAYTACASTEILSLPASIK